MEIAQIIDFAKFAMETEVDQFTLKELYEGFLEEIIEEKDSIKEFYLVRDFNNLVKTVHNIKGVSGSYYAGTLFSIASELNAWLKSGLTEEILNLEMNPTLNQTVNLTMNSQLNQQQISDSISDLLTAMEDVIDCIDRYFSLNYPK